MHTSAVSRSLKTVFCRGVLSLLVMVSAMDKAMAAQASDWIYFDLGEVIVTGNPTTGYTYVPGAMESLTAMRAAGFKLALITNIPESWGATCEHKFASLKTFLGDRLHETTPMDWTKFDAVVVPPFDRYRKPHKFMFIAGLARACPSRTLYVGEVSQEIGVARGLGFATFQVPADVGSRLQSPLPSVDLVRQLLATDFSFEQPADCNFDAIVGPILAPQDQDAGVAACAVDPAAL